MESGQNTVKLSGYGVSCDIVKDGVPSKNAATIRVYGLGRSLMNQITQLGYVWDYARQIVIPKIDLNAGGRALLEIFRCVRVAIPFEVSPAAADAEEKITLRVRRVTSATAAFAN